MDWIYQSIDYTLFDMILIIMITTTEIYLYK